VKLIPSEISLRTPSSAEKKIFNLLKHVELDGCVAMHSLNLSEHKYKVCSEIDFLILGPPGLFVLEVKGGRVARMDGVWTSTDRYGKTRTRSEGPFEQARSATFSLLDRLREVLQPQSIPGLNFGWAVVLPDQEFTEQSVEWAPEMVLDARVCMDASAFESGLRRLMRYSNAKGRGGRRLQPDQIKALRRALRPDYDQVPSLTLRSDQLDIDLQTLTESQYKVLDLVEDNDRILCEGGAGTGKTFLAAEIARREAATGHQVLLTCRSPIFARFLSEQPGLREVGCTTASLGDASRNSVKFDSIVVDEGQDVMNLEGLTSIDSLLHGGLETGRWRIFYDSNNQSGVLGTFDSAALELLNDAGAARVHLPDNCRNTRDIVTQVQLVTGADVGVSTAGAGIPVRYEFWETEEDEAGLLASYLNSLMDDGVEPRYVTVLSELSFEQSCVRLLPDRVRAKLRVLNAETIVRPSGGIGFASIRDFKGLENRFVCVADVTRLNDSSGSLSSLYVAMTRPRAGLWLGLSRTLKAELRNIRQREPGTGGQNETADE